MRRTLPGPGPDILAVIPARGGSKGIPRKNLQLLGGQPLVAWSIRAAQASRHVSRVVVSTDDPDIAALAAGLGAEVPFLRPDALSGDQALPGDAVAHAVDTLRDREGYVPAIVVELFPTHPFRPHGLIDRLVSKVLDGYGLALTVAAGGDGDGPFRFVRQGLVSVARLDGACRKRVHLHVLTDPASLVDIDGPEDLAAANILVKRGLFPVYAA